MVLKAAYALATYALPTGYYWHTAIGIGTLVVTYAFAQGKTTDRDRDLHARTVLVTGAFTPLGLTVISALASRGAHIIALSPHPLEHPYTALLLPALRAATKNEHIFAEHADLGSPASVREFCTKFLTGDDTRLDAIVFAHEYAGVGSVFAAKAEHERRREAGALATFLLTTLLLPALLVAPVERDIRIVNLVNPFYAAAVPSFTTDIISSMDPSKTAAPRPTLLAEGHRALRTVVLTRHLQRILNALPNRAPTLDPKPPGGVSEPGVTTPSAAKDDDPKTSEKNQPKFPSNIVAVSVAPGMSRSETIRVVLGADKAVDPEGYTWRGLFLYILFYPLVYLLAKSSTMASQSVLHTLFLPTPFKRALAHLAKATTAAPDAPAGAPEAEEKQGAATLTPDAFTEVLKPGALYRECSIVTLPVPGLPPKPEDKNAEGSGKEGEKAKKGKGKAAKGKEKEGVEELLDIEDDGEYGGEGVGRVVWEWYETHLRAWEAKEQKEKPKEEKEKEGLKAETAASQ